MSAATVAERLLAARSEVRRACDLLIAPTPEALNGCQDALERAISQLAPGPRLARCGRRFSARPGCYRAWHVFTTVGNESWGQ
jgi:hypothetical protein